MRNFLIAIVLLFAAISANAQVGIGTDMPHPSSQLDIVSKDKGLLIPRVALSSSTDEVTIANGNVESLLVYNTNTVQGVTPGYYYWYNNKWNRIVDAQDLPKNQITTLSDNGDGTYTYKNEEGVEVLIDIAAYETNSTLQYDSEENILVYTDEEGTETTIRFSTIIDDYETVTSVSSDAATGTVTFTDEDGTTTTLNIGDIISEQETLSTLVDNEDGSFTYTNEDGTETPILLSALIDDYETVTSVSSDAATGTITFKDEDGETNIVNINELVKSSAGSITSNDETIVVSDGGNSVLQDVDLSINEAKLELQKLSGELQLDQMEHGMPDQVLMTDESGTTVIWSSLTALGQGSITSSDLLITGGSSSTLGDVGIEIGNGVVASENIKDGSISTADLANAAITAGKLGGDIAGNGLTQNSTGALEVDFTEIEIEAEDITSAAELSATDNSITISNGQGAVLGAVNLMVSEKGITSGKIGDGAVVFGKIAADAVGASEIREDAVGSSEIAADAVTAEKLGGDIAGDGLIQNNTGALEVDIADLETDLAIGSITSSNLEVTGGASSTFGDVGISIGTGSITSDLILDLGISTADIASAAVTAEKLGGDIAGKGLTQNSTGGLEVDIADLETDLATGSITSTNLEVTGGASSTFGDVGISIGTGSITSDLILDRGISTADIANAAVTAEKLGGDIAGNGLAQNSTGALEVDFTEIEIGAEDITSAAELSATDNSITISNGEGAVLGAVNLMVSEKGITSGKIGDGAVVFGKIAADAVGASEIREDAVGSSEITENAVGNSEIAADAVTAEKLGGDIAGDGLIQNSTGALEVDFSQIEISLGLGTSAADLIGADSSIDVEDGEGSLLSTARIRVAKDGISAEKIAPKAVVSGKIAPDAVGASEIQENAVGSSEIAENAIINDNISETAGIAPTKMAGGPVNAVTVLTTGDDGTVSWEKAAMPKFFYMPSAIFDASTVGTFTKNLHAEYIAQFGTTKMSSTGANNSIPTLGAEELEYHITYFDSNVFELISLSADGILKYEVINPGTPASFMNIVFVVK